MTKNEFSALYEKALELAARNVETKYSHAIPREFEIEFHGFSPTKRILTKESSLQEIYINADLFYRIIDVSIFKVSRFVCTVFVRVSGHAPGSFEQTWNDPHGYGPFKQICADDVDFVK
jgi:hypothetical protein